MPVNKRQAKLAFVLPSPRPGFDPRHKLRAGKSAGTPFLGSAFQREIVGTCRVNGSQGVIVVSALGSDHGVLAKSHGWHRSNNSFKPTPLRGVV